LISFNYEVTQYFKTTAVSWSVTCRWTCWIESFNVQ